MSSSAEAFLIITHHWSGEEGGGGGVKRRPGNAGKCRKRYPQVRDGVGDFRQVNDRRLKLLIYFRYTAPTSISRHQSSKPTWALFNACQINRNCIEID